MSVFCLRGRNIRINEQRITRLGFSYMPNEIHSHMRWNLYTFLVKHFSLTGWQSFAVMAGCLLLCMVIPYLLGSFNFGLIISRRKYHDDIRIHGSGNAGTTNMLRTYGPKAAALTLGDMLKAALAVILGYLLVNNQAVAYNEAGRFIGVFGDKPGAAVAGLFVVVGHMFPCFFRFRGGKGVATTGMVILLLNPIVFLILFGIFAIIVLCTKYVSLASISAALMYPLVLNNLMKIRYGHGDLRIVFALAVCVLIIFLHRENIKRLIDGKENKFSFKKNGGKRNSSEK